MTSNAAQLWRRSALAVVSCIAVVGLGALVISRPINHDVAWGLTIADKVATGERLYRDILEVNPPLFFWGLSTVRTIGLNLEISPDALYQIVVLTITLGSGICIWRALNEPYAAVVFLACAIVLIDFDYGQRDILTALLVVPYLVIASSDTPQRSHVVLAGLLAGIGLALKPHYFLVWIGAAVFHRHRVADIAVLLVGVTYLLLIPVLTPDYISFVGTFGGLYAAWIDLHWIRRWVSVPVVSTAILGLTVALTGHRVRLPRWLYVFTVAAIGASLAFIIQGKGFSYHAVPALLFIASAGIGLLQRTRHRTAALAALGLVIVAARALAWPSSQPPRVREMHNVAREELASIVSSPNLVVLSHDLPRSFPASRMIGMKWRLPVPCVWWLGTSAAPVARDSLMRLIAVESGKADVLLIEPSLRDGRAWGPKLLEHLKADSNFAQVFNEFTLVDSGRYFFRFERRLN